MSDRELLEAAARAAGIDVIRARLDDPLSRDMLIIGSTRNKGQKAGPWNPLTDDGDALRLAVKLQLLVDFSSCCAMNLQCPNDDWFGGIADNDRIGCSPKEFDGPTVTRRAIVRAAAALGAAMGEKP